MTKVVIPDDEYAVKLTKDITGGLGSHAKDTVLRGLSFSAFNTLTCGGFGKRVMSTTAGDIVDYEDETSSAVSSEQPPKGSAAKG